MLHSGKLCPSDMHSTPASITGWGDRPGPSLNWDASCPRRFWLVRPSATQCATPASVSRADSTSNESWNALNTTHCSPARRHWWVFADATARADLEAILHPRIRAAWQAEAHGWRAAGQACGAVIIPLLFETGGERLFDAVICAACAKSTQWQRLRQRGWTTGQIRRRLEAQWPLEEKITRSDFVVWTDTTLPALGAQLERVVFHR